MNKEACDVSDEFPDLENVDSKDEKMALFYINIIRKAEDSSDDVLMSDTNFYHQKYGDFV